MKLDDLLRTLAEDQAGPERAFTPQLMLAAGLGFAASCALLLATAGSRPDWPTALGSWQAPLKMAFAMLLAVSGLWAALRAAQPDARPRALVAPLLAAPALLLLGVAAELATTPADSWSAAAMGTHPELCLAVVPLLGLAPLAAISIVMRRGAPANPAAAGALAGIAAGALGASAYMLRCTDDAPLFVMLWYGLAIGAMAATGCLAGSRLYRW